MSTKKYCFVPESYKKIKVYNPGTITDLKTIDNVNPNVQFSYCIDDLDKIKMFYVGAKREDDNTDNFEYIKYKTLQAIKSIFNVSELGSYDLIIEEGYPRIEFAIWYDTEGNHVPSLNLVEKNKYNTLLTHLYVYNFYKKYE